MSKIISLFVILSSLVPLISCGDRPAKKKDWDKEQSFIGSWQVVFDQSGLSSCDPNIDCKCADVISFYDLYTFDRNNQCDYKKGYYSIYGDRIQLTYVSENPQVYTYNMGTNEFNLVKGDTVYRYIRKPMKVRMEEAPIAPRTTTPTTSTPTTRVATTR